MRREREQPAIGKGEERQPPHGMAMAGLVEDPVVEAPQHRRALGEARIGRKRRAAIGSAHLSRAKLARVTIRKKSLLQPRRGTA